MHADFGIVAALQHHFHLLLEQGTTHAQD